MEIKTGIRTGICSEDVMSAAGWVVEKRPARYAADDIPLAAPASDFTSPKLPKVLKG